MGDHKPRANRIVLEGKTFGRLTVLEPQRQPGKALHYRCRCACGRETLVVGQNLRRGLTQSCGCLHRERARDSNWRHGKSKSSAHNIWLAMLQRCEDRNHKHYVDYGGRGITVCHEWHIFENFYRDMGDPPKGLTLDRKDNDGSYCKANCRWATRMKQANNRRSNKHLTFDGRTQTQAEWERELGLKAGRIYDRLYKGWTLERALSTR